MLVDWAARWEYARCFGIKRFAVLSFLFGDGLLIAGARWVACDVVGALFVDLGGARITVEEDPGEVVADEGTERATDEADDIVADDELDAGRRYSTVLTVIPLPDADGGAGGRSLVLGPEER